MTRVLRDQEVLGFTRPKPSKKHQRVEEPEVYTRLDPVHRIWEFYFCIYRDGRFARIDMPLAQAKQFLSDELVKVQTALDAQGKAMTKGGS
jgi:hypothetical protein